MVRRTPKRNVVSSSLAGGAKNSRVKPVWFAAAVCISPLVRTMSRRISPTIRLQCSARFIIIVLTSRFEQKEGLPRV